MAATRTGADIRPIANWATRRLRPALDFALGSVGAGTGATVVDLKGGLGSASTVTPQGHVVGALAAVNAVGSTVVGGGPCFWSAPFEVGSEFGGRGLPFPLPRAALDPRMKGVANTSTTLVAVATDAILTKAQANRLAVMAQTGFARAIYPVHTPLDGDVVSAAATGKKPLADPLFALPTSEPTPPTSWPAPLHARSMRRQPCPSAGALPSWKEKNSAADGRFRQDGTGANDGDTGNRYLNASPPSRSSTTACANVDLGHVCPFTRTGWMASWWRV